MAMLEFWCPNQECGFTLHANFGPATCPDCGADLHFASDEEPDLEDDHR